MTFDIRCQFACDLGRVISGGVSDTYVQETFLISTKGTFLMDGILTPPRGRIIRSAYAWAGGLTPFPRILTVLSATPAPYDGVTTVEVGDPLTLLAGRSRPEVVAGEIPTVGLNPLTAAAKEEVAPIVTAASVVNRCLEALGIGLEPGSFMPDKAYLESEFGLAEGYVAALARILESHSCYGFLRRNGNLVIRKIDLRAGGPGPLFNWESLDSVTPISGGQEPGRRIVVKYQALVADRNTGGIKDLADENANEERRRRNWEFDATEPVDTVVEIQWIQSGGGAQSQRVTQFKYQASSTSRTTYGAFTFTDRSTGEIRTEEVALERVETTTSALAAVNGSLCKSYLENGINPNGSAAALSSSVTRFTYAVGPSGLVPTLETREEFISGFALAGSLGITDYVIDEGVITVTSEPVLASRTVTQKIVNDVDGTTQTRVSRWVAWGLTQEGQQLAAVTARDADTADDVVDLINGATDLIFDGAQTSSSQGRDFGLQRRPPAAARQRDELSNGRSTQERSTEILFNWANPGGADIWPAEDMGADVTLSLPLSPDDHMVAEMIDANTLSTTLRRGDAQAAARAYGETINALRFAHANGSQVAGDPWQMPTEPLAPFYVEQGGVVAAFRTNGLSWAVSEAGMAIGTDALLCGGAAKLDGVTPTPWLPLSDGVASLPVLGTVTSTPGALPEGTVPVPDGFDPDVPGPLDGFPDTAAEFPVTIAPPIIRSPFQVVVPMEAGAGWRAELLTVPAARTPVEALQSGIVAGGELAEADDGILRSGIVTGGTIPGGEIPLGSITYSQSSVWIDNTAATNAAMTNNSSGETLQTGTQGTGSEWVRMDLGGVFPVRRVIIGTASSALAGGWVADDTNGCLLQYSINGTTWTTDSTISGLVMDQIAEIPVDWEARYIRITKAGFIAVTEFWASVVP